MCIRDSRKGFDLPTMEKWLAPNLSYDPDKIAASTVALAAPPKDSAPPCGCGTAHA